MQPLQKGTVMQARDQTAPQREALQCIFYDVSKILHLFYKLRLQRNILLKLSFW